MSSRRTVRQLLVAVLVGILVGGGLLAVTPAGAEVSSAVATKWKKIWKKELRPLADKRYYTKKSSDARYQPKGSYETAGSGYAKAETYSKAEADAKYQPKGSYEPAGSGYTKAESDAKYAPDPTVIRGAFAMSNAGSKDATEIDFGVSLSAPPTVHVIAPGSPPPAGCGGSLAAPDADPGNLCIFQRFNTNVSTLVVCNVDNACNTTSPFGAWLIAFWDGSGALESLGSWAVRPAALAAPGARPAPSTRGGTSAAGE